MAEPLNSGIKNFILENIPKLKEETICNDDLLDRLVSCGFSLVEKQEIKSKPTPDSRASELYTTLARKSQEKYIKTIQALKASGQKTAAGILENGLGENYCASRKTEDAIWFEVEYLPESFTGREDELKQLHVLVTKSTREPTVINQVSTVAGLGGIGKSTLARKYAYSYKDYYSGNVIWVNSETRESFRSSLTRLHEKYFDTTKLKSDTDEELLQMIYDNISTRKQRCLLIFDNVEEFHILKLLPKYSKPDASNSSIPYVLITSRKTQWRPGVGVLQLNVLSADEATQLLKNCTRAGQAVKQEDLKKLAEYLQCLPLALHQAAAYINEVLSEHSTPIKRYLELFNNLDRCRALLDYKNEDLSEHERTTFHTWTITFENIHKKEYGPVAIQIMKISSFLQADNIPSTIFVGSNETSDSNLDPGRYNQDTDTGGSSGGISSDNFGWSQDDVNAAIALLKKYSMVSGSAGVINVHRLVQRVVKLKITIENNAYSALEQGLRLIQLVGNKQGKAYLDSTYLHADLIWRHALNHDELIQKYVEIVFMLCETDDRFLRGTAEDHKQHIVRVFGPNHENTIRILYYEANEQSNRFPSKTSKSLKILQEIGPLATAELGVNHDLTDRIYELIFKNLKKLNKHEEALKAAEELEVLRLKKYGSENGKTLDTLLYKGSVLSKLGRVQEALVLFRRLNEVFNRVDNLPVEYSVKRVMHDLSIMLVQKAELDETANFLRTLIEVWTRKEYGIDLNEINRLAAAIMERENLDEAVELLRLLVEGWTRIKGAEDYVTLSISEALAGALLKKGEWNKALELLRTRVEVWTRVKGAEDLWTLYAMKDLADGLMEKGELDEALSLYESIYETIFSTNFVFGWLPKFEFIHNLSRALLKCKTKLRWVKLRKSILSSEFIMYNF